MSDTLAEGTHVLLLSEATRMVYDAEVKQVMPDHPSGKVYLVTPNSPSQRWSAWAAPESVVEVVEGTPTVCQQCGVEVRWVEAPTGGWWKHETHPANDHDAWVR